MIVVFKGETALAMMTKTLGFGEAIDSSPHIVRSTFPILHVREFPFIFHQVLFSSTNALSEVVVVEAISSFSAMFSAAKNSISKGAFM